LTFKPALILALLSHRVLSKLLRSSKGSLLIVSVAVYEIVVLFLILLSLTRLLGVVRTKNTAVTVSHVALSGEFTFSLLLLDSRLVFKVGLAHFHIGLLAVSFDLSYHGVRLIPQVVLVRTQGVSVRVFLLFIEQVTRRPRRVVSRLPLARCLVRYGSLVLGGGWPGRSLFAHVELIFESSILLLTPI